MANELSIKIDYSSSEIIQTLKATVAQNATDSEFKLFIEFAKSTGLNPFKREIWFIKANDRVQIMTGINGFYAIANNHPMYNGMSEPEFGKDDAGLFCKVSVYRKDRTYPQVAKIYDSEFNKHWGNWKTMGRYMLSKCAEAVALRKSFPQELNGLYTSEEMPPEYSNVAQVETPKPEPKIVVVEKKKILTEEQRKTWFKYSVEKLETLEGDLKDMARDEFKRMGALRDGNILYSQFKIKDCEFALMEEPKND